jgi:hypothetical protein
MASGNQMCNPSCADFPKTPQNNRKETTLITEKSKQKNENVLSSKIGSKPKITA